jgi:4-amino-4-deoxy-L-arabinose transferase-like glycosyltransferase
VLQALLGTAAVALICLIALRLWGTLTALVAGSIAAVYPPLVLVGSSLMSEPLFIAVELGAVLAALVHRDSSRRWRWVLLSGVLTGLAALTRGNGLALLVPLWFLVWNERPRWSWRALRAPLALVAATVVTLVPWSVRNQVVFGQFVGITTQGGYALAGTYNPQVQHDRRYPAMWQAPFTEVAAIDRADPTATEATISRHLMTGALDYITAHPASLLKSVYWNTLRLLNLRGAGFERWFAPYEGYPPTLAGLSVYAFWVLALAAIAALFARAARAVPIALWGCPLAIALCAIPLLGSTRYRSPADPFLVMLAGVVLVAAYHRLRPRLAPAGVGG